MVKRRTVLCLGVSSLISWGITYYLIGGFGELIASDLHWGPAQVQGGFSVGLIVMGVSSRLVGRLIDEWGGRPVMVAGSLMSALGCLGIAMASTLAVYYSAWVFLGLAMRCTLYDAAFAALARIGGPDAKRAMSQITLLGGLASSTFWPIGHYLAEHLGWRLALACYAGFALLTVPLHLAIPADHFASRPQALERPVPNPPLAANRTDYILASSLYALIATLSNFLNSAMSAHMIGILGGLGLTTSLSVWIATLRGIGQSSGRLGEVVFGGKISVLDLNLLASAGLPLCFILGLWSGLSIAAAVSFAFLFGAANGVLTITRGTLPLALFDPITYGTVVGSLIAPSFVLSAGAPVLYVFVIERWGNAAALAVSGLLGLLTFAAALALRVRFGRPPTGP